MPTSPATTDQRLWVANALNDLDANERALDRLAQSHIIIRTAQNPTDYERLAAAMLYSLCSRVFPNSEIDLDGFLPPNPWAAQTVADFTESQPVAAPRSHSAPQRIVIAIGQKAGTADFHVAGDDWTSMVSRAPISTTLSPVRHGSLGLYAAATLVASEIFKLALSDLGLRTLRIEAEMVWNLIDYRLRRAPLVEISDCACHHEFLFIGAGSLSSSAMALLALLDLAASIEVIDNDDFDPIYNPFRYPAATTSTSGSKAHWLASIANASPSLTAHPKHQSLEEWMGQRTSPGFDGTAVVTVDRVDARRKAADLAARHTISAGVNGLATELHRSNATDDAEACSYCLHIDASDPYDQVDVYADLTGLTSTRIRELLDGDRLTRADIEATKVPVDDHLIGRRFEDLVRSAYAEAEVPSTDGESRPARIAAPHVSWLTGLTIAAEILKQSLGAPILDRRLRVDLHGLPLGVTDRPEREPTGRCLCHNPIRREAARAWYKDT